MSAPISRMRRPGPIVRPATADTSADIPGRASLGSGSPRTPPCCSGLLPSGQGIDTFSHVRTHASEISDTDGTPKKCPTGA